MQAASMPNWPHNLLSDVGRQRQGGINQDAAVAIALPNGGLFAVADGMGGHAAGELASNLALEALSKHYLSPRSTPPVRLAEAVQAANVAVLRHAVGEYVGMGTTLIAALIDRGALLIAHVGDSRAYLLRGSSLYRLTEDHSWVSEQVRLGHLTEAEARGHQWRSVVSNALGAEERVRLELFGLQLRAGDRLLLCSDGLSSVVSDDQLLTLLSRPLELAALTRSLIAKANDAGGPDNITALLIDVRQDLGLPSYGLPAARGQGPDSVDTFLSSQRGTSLHTYLLLLTVYFMLLGVMLMPLHRLYSGLTGLALLAGVFLLQRYMVLRQARGQLGRPCATLSAPAPHSPDPRERTGDAHTAPDPHSPRRDTGR